MLRSLPSPRDANDDHLRFLSDHRNIHFASHARLPSLTEFPDSPSVYSHPYFSPHPLERDDDAIDSDGTSFTSTLSSIPHHNDLPPSHRDLLNHPPARSFDLDDETASTCRSISTVDAEDDSDFDDDTDDASNRISLQGPRIRFHSRAPWETGDDTLQGEESDHSPRSGTIASKFKGKVPKADSLMRTFGRGASITTRPSVESTRSQSSSKSSFEIAVGNYLGSRGAL
ncbi:hypothetical protein BDN67DRAFT_1006721 [Paxillus ammoniavirescens]|nr:hypothetical protein BDN67DRAFT_1006721 [Paxillus ammoniavirescens]